VKIAVNRPFEAIGSLAHVNELLSARPRLDNSLCMLETKMGNDEQAAQNRATTTIRHAHDVGLDV
jgi:hypothetical protein